MTKRVQILGHDAETANQFVGEDREITVDTDNRELRLHDATNPGGKRLLNRDQTDERYQRRSTELDGLLGWEPNEWGFVTRIGPGLYRLRALTWNAANIAVENPDGHDDDPYISLAATITSDHQWTGEHEFTQPVTGTGGFVGDVTGNLTGDSEGHHTGNVTGNVTGNLTGNSTGNHTGGVDTRDAVLIMDVEQIDPTWIAGLSGLLANAGLPVGSIVAFSGAVGAVPENWAICDGTGGTPDLRDRFIVGAGVEVEVGTSGGSMTHDHPLSTLPSGAHAHAGNVGDTVLEVDQLPSHRHNNGVTDQSTNKIFCYGGTAAAAGSFDHVENSGGGSGVNQGYTSNTGSGNPHTHTLDLAEGGAHTHEGGTAAASNLPPYFAMLYIMKVS